MYRSIQPVATTYKGIQFRSRLEVRWSIVFDSLGTNWAYEPAHYDFGAKRPWLDDEYEFREYVQEQMYDGLERSEAFATAYHDRYEHEHYLPDFQLRDFNHWVEIKGKSPTWQEQSKASQLASNTGRPVTILWGYIPDPQAKLWGECSEVYGGEMNIIALLVLEYGTTAMEHAFAAARRIKFGQTDS